jgi:hypothetical protein
MIPSYGPSLVGRVACGNGQRPGESPSASLLASLLVVASRSGRAGGLWRELGAAGDQQVAQVLDRLAERAITYAIAEPDEDLALARLAFLAQDDHATLEQRSMPAWTAPSAPSIPAGAPSASSSGRSCTDDHQVAVLRGEVAMQCRFVDRRQAEQQPGVVGTRAGRVHGQHLHGVRPPQARRAPDLASASPRRSPARRRTP